MFFCGICSDDVGIWALAAEVTRLEGSVMFWVKVISVGMARASDLISRVKGYSSM